MMATFDKLIYNIPPYQEGNEADFEFDIDANFPMEIVDDVTFQVKNDRGHPILSKKASTGGITINDRTITIKFPPKDTKGKAGRYVYEIDFINLNNNPFATIGGTFVINKEINTL